MAQLDVRNNLNRLAHFVAIIEEGTITAAAQRLGVGKAVVSKQLIMLEADVGVDLVIRNTRHLKPTDVGLTFYEKSKSALEQANEAYAAARDGTHEPIGRLRITAPVDYGTLHIAPLLGHYSRAYPKVQIDLTLSDDRLDPVQHQFDLSFRVGWLKDSSNLTRKIADFKELAVCSREFARDNQIEHPSQLERCSFIANKALSNPTKWSFSNKEETVEIDARKAINMNFGAAIKTTVMAGGGVAVLPDFLVSSELAAGSMIHVFPNWKLRRGGIFAVFPATKHRSAASKMFIDMVLAHHKGRVEIPKR
ncbi:LysR family transcriptional regulator [Roseibium algae]|uniref:LysR family transcriptional regulator n=1 Tax=Roseibium algae TaxID=3123038 RepID=A0ABU8TME3_9HYPH